MVIWQLKHCAAEHAAFTQSCLSNCLSDGGEKQTHVFTRLWHLLKMPRQPDLSCSSSVPARWGTSVSEGKVELAAFVSEHVS